MAARSESALEPALVIKRIFDAPRDLVFRAWTDPEQLVRWYAPNGCTILFRRLDARAGGEFHSCIRTPTGHECWCMGIYREVVIPERIVFTMAVSDANGNAVEPADVGMDPDWPRETVVTVTFVGALGRLVTATGFDGVDVPEALLARTRYQ